MDTNKIEKRVLIIEDETPLRTLYQRRLTRKGYHVSDFATAEEGLDILEKESFQVALVDIRMPGMSGLDFLKIVEKRYPALEVIVITAFGSIESAVQAIKLGAYDYLTKPCHLPELELVVGKAFEKTVLQQQNLLLREELRAKDNYDSFIYTSPAMREVIKDVEKVAPTDSPVIIEGESGTGKELIANTIHKLSPRKSSSFIVINCANLQEYLVENELFGHEKGAYTGADRQKRGLIELADHGTLFIDEIGEMHSSAQAKLLRVLENRAFRRVGGNAELHADVRIIAATNQNLTEEIARGRFRSDLFFRLNVVRLHIPPLRERKEDIPLLMDYFLEKKNRVLNAAKKISPAAQQLFLKYEWPGNVRELANVIERAIILSPGEHIEPQELPFRESPDDRFDPAPLKEIEKIHILKVLRSTDGNKTRTAKVLGISLRNLYRKLEQYGAEPDAPKSSSPSILKL